MDICPSMFYNKQQIYDKHMEQDGPVFIKALPTCIYLEQILCCRTYHRCGDFFEEITNRLVKVSFHEYL